MTYQDNFTVPAELMEQVQEEGLDVLSELIRIMINAALATSASWKESGLVFTTDVGSHFTPQPG